MTAANDNTKPVSSKTKIIAAVLLAATAISPFTKSSEGSKNHAYLDPAKIPTICNGHTQGVKMGDVASDAQCLQYQKEDMEANMQLVLKFNPELVDQPHALMASGDFAYNAGIGSWKNSPMASYFHQKKWTEGCNAFKGYFVNVTAPKPVKGSVCKPSASHPGKYTCALGGLITRRLSESKICLTGSWK